MWKCSMIPARHARMAAEPINLPSHAAAAEIERGDRMVRFAA